MLRSHAMTIGQLSQRTGVSIKTLREYERLGFLYTLGRSESNYRLFGDEAVWCVRVVQGLRSLGLTLKQIQELVTHYLGPPHDPGADFDTHLEEYLTQAAAHAEAQIADLQALRQRICDFQRDIHAARANHHLPTSALVRLLAADPRHITLTSAS